MKNTLNPEYENLKIGTRNLPISFSLRESSPDYKGCAFHWHEAIEIYYVKEGSLSLNTNGSFYRLEAGDVGIVGWGMPHRGLDFAKNTKHYIIQVDTKKIPQLATFPQIQMPRPLASIKIPNNKVAQSLLDEVIDSLNSEDKESKLEALASLFKFLALIIRIDSYSAQDFSTVNITSLSYIHSILKYINNHITEKISLDTMAKALGLSKSYMCRLFKKHTNQTMVEHINEQKCNFAATLISSGVSLQDTCTQSGFSDYNYFSRVFKKTIGQQPSSFTK